MKTATEKYNAVLEGKMAEKEFVRQMRQQFPNFISQFNGFKDSVQILKNKGMIFEAKKEEDKGYKVPEVNISLDVIERGVDAELEAAGIDSAGNVTKEQYLEAKRKALHNLKKDMNHYLNLMAGESSKVDKNDKMKETKRGAQDKDTYNDLKKAELKESNSKSKPGYTASGKPKSNAEMGDDEREEFYNDLDSVEEAKPTLREALESAIQVIKDKYGDLEGINQIIKDFLKVHAQDLAGGADPLDEFENYIDVNYDSLDEASIDEEFSEFKTYDDIIGGIYIRFDELQKYIAKHEPEYIPHIEKIRRSFRNLDDSMAYGPNNQPEVDEAKKANKDYDKDGKIESGKEEYKGAKDRAIKAAMGKQDQLKEAVKTIIKRVLSEGTVNEAATAKLASWADAYLEIPGMKPAINQLENIVTEVETFYYKINNKVKDIFEKIGEIDNGAGLPVGAIIAPSIEKALRHDLKPVQRLFLTGIELPKVQMPSQADVDAAISRAELSEDPKQTVYTPVAESKKRK